MADKIRILALGGLDADSKNLYIVEINDDIFIVSCGLGYPDKSTPGIDFVIPDISYLRENKHRVKAYIFQDSHDNTLFGLPFIYNEIPAPIYMTEFSKEVFFTFVSSLNPIYKLNYDIRCVDPNGETTIAGRKVSFFEISHSNPFTFGVAIDSSEGNIIFSGDFIIEYNKTPGFRFNMNKLTQIVNEKPTYILLADSTNSGRKGFTSPSHRSEHILRKGINDSEGRIYIAVYSQNIYGFYETISSCITAGKYVYFYDEETLNLYKILEKHGVYKIPASKIITTDDLNKYADKDIAVIMTGSGELLYNKISMLAIKDIKEKRLYIKDTDVFILNCPAAPNFEVLSVGVLDELYKCDCKVIHASRKTVARIHPSEDDLKFFISIVQPKYYIPIQGQYKDLIHNATIAADMNIGLNHTSIFLIDNGFAIDFVNGKVSLKSVEEENDKVRIGPILVDGTGVGDVANEIINERNRLSEDGVIVMSVLVSLSEKAIIGGPDIQMRGYLYLKESEQILKKIQTLFIDLVNAHLNDPVLPFNEERCLKEIKDQCTKFTKKSTLRSPLIEPHLLIFK